MLLVIRHFLTWVVMMDIINLINKLFDKNILNLSKFKLFSFFSNNNELYKYHINCPQCKSYAGERTNLPNRAFVCPVCHIIIKKI